MPTLTKTYSESPFTVPPSEKHKSVGSLIENFLLEDHYQNKQQIADPEAKKIQNEIVKELFLKRLVES